MGGRNELEDILFGKEKAKAKHIEVVEPVWKPKKNVELKISKAPISIILKEVPSTHILTGCEGTIFDVFETNKGYYVLTRIPEFLNLHECVKYVIIHKENFELNGI